MSSLVEFVIGTDGSFKRRTVQEDTITVDPAALDSLSDNATHKLPNFIHITPHGPAGLSVRQTNHVWSVPMPQLRLRAPFRLLNVGRSKVLTPSFGSTSDPMMDLTWDAPGNMLIRFVVSMQYTHPQWSISKCWLFAFDGNRRAYQLPLANLYDDCGICMGEYQISYLTSMEGLMKSLDQFEKSKWNADLFGGTKYDNSASLFRFDAETLKSINPGASWQPHALVVANPILEQVII